MLPTADEGQESQSAHTWQIKITDFGIASRLSHENPSVSSPTRLEGTLPYISPEQTGRMNRLVDYRTDFYSLGVTLYEMLTGQRPFVETEPMALIHAHIAKEPQPPTTLRPDIPPMLSAIILKLLAKTAEERYQSAYGLKADLEACLAQLSQPEHWEEPLDKHQTELAVLRAERPQAPAVHINTPQGASENVLEAACLLSARLQNVEDHADVKDLEAADKQFRGRLSLQELLLEAAWAHGYTGRNFRDARGVLQAAFAPVNAANGFSTINIGGILSNVSNKFLLEGFNRVEAAWRDITAIRSVNDFKTVTSYRMVGANQYERIAPGGVIKNGNLGEESYQNKADTYGLMLSIDRRDIINDDLGAITDVPRMIGRGAGLKINDVFWSIFMENASFFTVAHKNLQSGNASSLSIDGLTAAETAFLEQTDPDGKPLALKPALMLVPPALNVTADQLRTALEIRNTSANKKEPTNNPHRGKFRSVMSSYLSNPNYPGHSASAWYLLSDPLDVPVIETAFLNGQESPVIESANADFNTLGIQMRGYHDFGVALQEFRGGVKSTGA